MLQLLRNICAAAFGQAESGASGVAVRLVPVLWGLVSSQTFPQVLQQQQLTACLCPRPRRTKEADKARRYNCFARGQTRYVMGDAGSSYLVGFGKGGSGYAQVMGASCPGLPVQGKAQVRV